MLAKNPTRKALGDTVLGNDMLHTGTAAGGAYQFPEAASLRISFSNVKSETERRNCLFSVSSSLSRLTWSPFRPPYSSASDSTLLPSHLSSEPLPRSDGPAKPVLPQLRDDLFRSVSLPCHSLVLHQAISHTSGRTTSQGADHHALRA